MKLLLAASGICIIALGVLVLSTPRVRASDSAVSFTAAQVAAGSHAYEMHCAMCHGANLEGGAGPALRGANFKPLENVGADVGGIFTFMTTNMPMNAPASLSRDDYVEITAFILSKNGHDAGSIPLTYEAALKSKASITGANRVTE